MKYRLIVGEMNDKQGHIVKTTASSLVGAKIALRRAMATYKGDGWGRIEYLRASAKESVTELDMWDRLPYLSVTDSLRVKNIV